MPEQNNAFLEQIPEHLKDGAEIHSIYDMSVFRPRCFATGATIQTKDYHICLPTSTPPPLFIEGTEYQYQKGRIILLPPDTCVSIENALPDASLYSTEYIKVIFQ